MLANLLDLITIIVGTIQCTGNLSFITIRFNSLFTQLIQMKTFFKLLKKCHILPWEHNYIPVIEYKTESQNIFFIIIKQGEDAIVKLSQGQC